MYNRNSNNPISKEHAKYISKIKRNRLMVRFSQIAILLAFIALWELAARLNLIDAFITSQPSRIISTIKSLYQEGVLLMHVSITIYETIIGFVLGTMLGTVVAIILWWSEFAAKVADPIWWF